MEEFLAILKAIANASDEEFRAVEQYCKVEVKFDLDGSVNASPSRESVQTQRRQQ